MPKRIRSQHKATNRKGILRTNNFLQIQLCFGQLSFKPFLFLLQILNLEIKLAEFSSIVVKFLIGFDKRFVLLFRLLIFNLLGGDRGVEVGYTPFEFVGMGLLAGERLEAFLLGLELGHTIFPERFD